MKIPKLAIERAIEGGWEDVLAKVYEDYMWEQIFYKAEFWKSLCSGLGWPLTARTGALHNKSLFVWECWAHDFYDLILTGQSTDNFWNELLPNP